MNLVTILLEIHSGVRWLVVLAALVVVVKYVISLIRKNRYNKLDGILWTIFVRTFSVQWLLGLVVFSHRIIIGAFVINHIYHLVIMTLAIGMVEMGGKRFEGQHRNLLLAAVGSLVIIFFGVLVLPAGMSRWTM